MTIILFGDTHGNIALMLRLARAWQGQHGPLSAIGQVGDLGVWPNPDKVDAATKRKISEGKETLGFLDLLKDAPLISEAYAGEHPLRCPVYFVGGNHEDYDYLAACAGRSPDPIVPVDARSRFFYLKNGCRTTIETSSGDVTIAGVGGLHTGARPKQERREPRITHTQDDLCAVLGNGPVDALLTHAPPVDADFKGSQDFELLHQLLEPAYHFFGHRHKAYGPADCAASKTRLIGLANVGFDHDDGLNRGCMAALYRKDGRLIAEHVDEPWFRDVNSRSWKWL
jgi:hypothetical protein